MKKRCLTFLISTIIAFAILFSLTLTGLLLVALSKENPGILKPISIVIFSIFLGYSFIAIIIDIIAIIKLKKAKSKEEISKITKLVTFLGGPRNGLMLRSLKDDDFVDNKEDI